MAWSSSAWVWPLALPLEPPRPELLPFPARGWLLLLLSPALPLEPPRPELLPLPARGWLLLPLALPLAWLVVCLRPSRAMTLTLRAR